jgi:hypothetical protein
LPRDGEQAAVDKRPCPDSFAGAAQTKTLSDARVMTSFDQARVRPGAQPCRAAGWLRLLPGLLLTAWLAASAEALRAEDTNHTPALPILKLGGWTPVFQGVEHLNGQTLAGAYGNQVVHALRVDLQDPDVRFFTTPASTNAQVYGGETIGQTTSQFLSSNNLQAAINANFFFACCGLPEAPVMYVFGLAVSRGIMVSQQDDAYYAATLVLTSNNVPTIIATNWPPIDTNGIYTAVTGNRPLVLQGTNVALSGLANPRTAIGYTQDKRYLILLTVDGRQPGYSDGSTDFDTAQWLIRLGAYDAINLDGGGSTTMVIADGRGGAIELNRAIDSYIPGHERICGNHFGVYAKPLPAPAVGATNSLFSQSVAIAGLVPGFHRLAARGLPGGIYRLEYADSLTSTNWQTLTTSPVGEQGFFEYLDAAAAGMRFYRAVKMTDPYPSGTITP